MANALSAHINRHGSKYAWIGVCCTLVAGFEGFASRPYRDSVGVRTVCFGQTAADGADFSRVYTKAQCLQLLGRDLPKYDAPLKRCIKPEVYNALPPYRHAALVSLAYNIGAGGVCKSSVVRELNAGRVAAACNDFLKYDRAGGRVLKGLVNRRRAERAACLRSN